MQQWFALLAFVVAFTETSGQVLIRNKGCKFPFTYNGETYNFCTTAGGAKTPWCAQDAVYVKGRFTECLPSECVFPFTYEGKTFNTCTNYKSENYWCSVTADYKGRFVSCKDFEGPFEKVDQKKDEKREEVTIERVVCLDSNKKTHNVGEKYDDGCERRECTKHGGRVIQAKCPGKVGCHDVGHNGYQCVIRGQTYDYCSCKKRGDQLYNEAEEDTPVVKREKQEKVEKQERQEKEEKAEEEKPEVFCKDDRTRKAYRVGDRWESGCEVRQCSENGVARVILAKCQGKKGCFEVGQSGYPCDQKGKSYASCMCSGKKNSADASNLVDEDSIILPEVEEFCVAQDNRKYKVGDRWIHDCTQYSCGKGKSVNFISAKCQDRDGRCVDIGTKDFKCVMKGRKYDDCVCKGDSQNPFAEGTIPEDAKDVKKTQVKMCFDTNGNMATTWKDGCTEFFCDNGESRVRKQRCRDDADKCFDINTKGFACNMDGKMWKSCICEMAGDAPSLSAAMG